MVLFYCGNEGDVEWFADNAGWLRNEAAGALNALLVFVEHRYFGQSMPFGVDSFLPGISPYKNKTYNIFQYCSTSLFPILCQHYSLGILGIMFLIVDMLGNVRYLSVSQALADYANAINYIKAKEAIPKAKFIAVGGSYGMSCHVFSL